MLLPGKDFYLISLHPEVFEVFNGFPSVTYLPIARIKAGPLSNLSLNESYGGLTGHYTFITKSMITRHHNASQKIGTGFIHSRYSLFREINRGVDWIFSNHAVWLQKMVNDLLGCAKLS
jgi:glycerophosphoryl diester phosphodiesterase